MFEGAAHLSDRALYGARRAGSDVAGLGNSQLGSVPGHVLPCKAGNPGRTLRDTATMELNRVL